MPHTTSQWLWFFFYSGGAIGGWLIIPLALWELRRSWRKAPCPEQPPK
jgi:hypothetical protein